MNNFGFNRAGKPGRLLLFFLLLTLAACGFHMRGVSSLPFDSIHFSGQASIAADLKKSFASSGVKVMPAEEGAQMLLELLKEKNDKRILSLSGGGKVREYDLIYLLSYRSRVAGAAEWGPEQNVELHRDFSYDDSKLLAKGMEENLLFNDIRAEAVREVMRRLNATSRKVP